jgi:hypothetical protein
MPTFGTVGDPSLVRPRAYCSYGHGPIRDTERPKVVPQQMPRRVAVFAERSTALRFVTWRRSGANVALRGGMLPGQLRENVAGRVNAVARRRRRT